MTTKAMLDYISASPSPYHCVETSARLLEDKGFLEVNERGMPVELPPGSAHFVRRGGTLVCWRTGTAPVGEAGFRIMGAHTDSPNLRVKPKPDADCEGYRRWGVEVYGGVLLSTWMDRDLGLAGRVYVRTPKGEPKARLVNIDRPIARVPNLAIHLNRGVNKEGLKLDEQKHLVPMLGMAEEDADGFTSILASELSVEAKDILSWDLCFYDVQPPCVGGLDGEFIFSARLDNQASCHQALTALLESEAAPWTQVAVLFDHEEVGSRSATGAMGSFFRDILTRIERDQKERSQGGLERALANSILISMDMAHGVHPNYADVHEPNHKPVLNGGPVIKEHVEQRYATDAETSALFRMACERADVPVQDFVIRTDLACGSTIGPISSAELAVRTVDVGNAMLSMHSIREQCGTKDNALMIKALTAFLSEQ